MDTISIPSGDFRLSQWIEKTEMKRTAKIVFIYLATHARNLDRTWPSQELLAKKIGVCVRTLRNCLAELETQGFIRRIWQRIRGKMKRVYVFLNHSAIPAKNKKSPTIPDIVEPTGSEFCAPPVRQNSPENPVGNAEPVYISNQLIESPLPPQVDTAPTDRKIVEEGGSDAKKEAEAAIEEVVEETVGQDPAWVAAKEILCRDNPKLRPLVGQLVARRTETGTLSLDGPNPTITGIIEKKFGEKISNALQYVGIIDFSYGVQPDELRKKLELKALAMDFRRQADEVQATAQARIQAAELQAQQMAKKSPKQQIKIIMDEYPLKKGQWLAEKVFETMSKRKQLPDVMVLLSAIRRQKADPAWQRDGGRWIPAMSKWLRERRWLD